MPKLKIALYQLERLMQIYIPDIYGDLLSKEISCEFYGIQWFITLFSTDFEEPYLHIVWDMFIVCGWKVIFRLALSILRLLQREIAEFDYEKLICLLKNDIRDNKLLQILAIKNMLKFKVTNNQLLLLQEEYRAKNSFMKMKQNESILTELESLEMLKPHKVNDISTEDQTESPVKIQPIRSINTGRNYTDRPIERIALRKSICAHREEYIIQHNKAKRQPLISKRLSKDSCNISTSTLNSPHRESIEGMHHTIPGVLIHKGSKNY